MRSALTAVHALLLVLLAASFHASWNLVLHETPDRQAAQAIGGVASFVLLLPFIILFPPWAEWRFFLPSALAEPAYAISLAAAYRRGALSLAYPIGRGTAPLLVTLASAVFLHQSFTPVTLLATLFLISGLLLVATAQEHHADRQAISFALLTGCCIASYSTIDANAVHYVNPLSYLGVIMGLQGVFLMGICRTDVSRLYKSWKPGILIGTGSLIAYALVLFAFHLAAAGRVATLREVSVLLGILLTRKAIGKQVWIGAGLVVLGAVFAAS